jgi:UDP-N-acetylglucosamine 2-epimerase (non-hydrolysing)
VKAIRAVLKDMRPDIVYVQGDTNTVVAGAIAASQSRIRLAHVEAGLRSYDRAMPEESNRIITDHLSTYLFVPTEHQKSIVQQEGIDDARLSVTGNTIVDAVYQHQSLAAQTLNDELKIPYLPQSYVVLTLHRPANIDDHDRFARIVQAINRLAERYPIIFPVHPRTQRVIKQQQTVWHANVHLAPPIGYLSMLTLMGSAKFILTDSGGIQEEACILHRPCLTLRENTERPETVVVGSNILVGDSQERLFNGVAHFERQSRQWSQPYGDGHAAERIFEYIHGHPSIELA